MKNKWLLIALWCPVVIASGGARANDSAFSGVGGTPLPMRGEHRLIQMQSERILIRADDSGYSTDVDFVFVNHGAKTSVQMGFPESSSEDAEAEKKSVFKRFATSVDGQKVVAKRVITSKGGPETEAFWLKTVDFGARQTRRVRVSYRSPWGGNTDWGTRTALIYDFTGANWRGQVDQSDLEIRVADPGLWTALASFEGQPLAMDFHLVSSGDSANTPGKGPAKMAIFRKTWRNWQAQGGFTFGLTRSVPFWMLDRSELSGIAGTPQALRFARTFRIGAVPDELPRGAETPPAFRRNGVDYILLTHLERRLDEFAYDLEKHRGYKPKVDVKWNAQTGIATLIAGNKALDFSPHESGNQLHAILLRSKDGNALYVPLAPVAKKWGLSFKTDPKNRLFDLNRGTWTGK